MTQARMQTPKLKRQTRFDQKKGAGVLVGGAPLNEAFGESVGADAYCRDAAVAVETAKALIAKRREAGAA